MRVAIELVYGKKSYYDAAVCDVVDGVLVVEWTDLSTGEVVHDYYPMNTVVGWTVRRPGRSAA